MRIKKSYENLIPYQVEQIDVNLRLDANENVDLKLFSISDLNQIAFNQYPNNESLNLVKAIAKVYQVNQSSVITGNGSSELLELMVKTFVEPHEVVMSFHPSFSMYQVYAKLYNAKFVGVPLNDDMSFNIDLMIETAQKYQPKIIFLCNPNNPTGSILSRSSVLKIMNHTNAIIIVDEAYIEFSDEDISLIRHVNQYERLVVTRTFSKAYGLASIRLGFLVSNQVIIDQLKKVVVPYHLNALSQKIGELALKKKDRVISNAKTIRVERQKLEIIFEKLGFKVFHSQGNFVFIHSNIQNLKQVLIEKNILIRDFKIPFDHYYRITIGTPKQNEQLIQTLKEISEHETSKHKTSNKRNNN
jgi:histidinol-phosphate aminotransferase